MKLIELDTNDFTEFADNHQLRNYCQTEKYAKLMGENGYDYDYIGFTDDSNNLVAASLILKKKIGSSKYLYAPKGLLIDYYNTELVKIFVKELTNFYKKKGYTFLKINPEIIIGTLDASKYLLPTYNQNVNIIDTLKTMNFKRRREIFPLDYIFPRINPYINLKNYNREMLLPEINDEIKISLNNGLSIETGNKFDIDAFYELIKNNTYYPISFYKSLLNIYKDGELDFLLVKVNYEDYLINVRNAYEKEQENNNYWNERIQTDNNEDNLKEKMDSDKELIFLKDEIVKATEGLRKNKYKIIAGTMTIKYKNRVSIIALGIDKDDGENLNAGLYLYNSLIEMYKNDYEFLDLNGLGSNLNPDNKYSNFNACKLAFNPIIYEFIGEFDLVFNELNFKKIQSKGLLSKEFYSSHKFED